MTKVFNNKINLLKALAILIVVSGHLEFSLIPMFPPYSFQIVLFFFIAGMLFNEKYSFGEYINKRIKSLLIPYFVYECVYIVITILMVPVVGKFWGMPVSIKNEILMPFITGHQLDLIAPLWFVPQLFISLILYYVLNKFFNRIRFPYLVRFIFFVILALMAIQLGRFADNIYILPVIRTLFSFLFIFAGVYYKAEVENKKNIFTPLVFGFVIFLQAILWLTNMDYTPIDGIGLSYILVWGEFDNWIVPILTSFTGIWISLFIVEIFYNYIKDWSFINKIGQNTYHIMANHILIFDLITYFLLYIKGIPFDIKNNADVYWFYSPLKFTYLYFVIGIFVTTYIGEFIKFVKRIFEKKFSRK